MTLPQYYDLCRYWGSYPPEHESLAMLLSAYTSWEPANARPMTQEEHRKSLEQRWKAGSMNVKQMFEAMGGALSLDGSPGGRLTGANLPGIGPFPGAH
jgi:hypothetical protein